MAHRGRAYLRQPVGEPRMTTVVRPRRNGYPSDWQFSAQDYISVPAITYGRGMVSVAEACRFTVGLNSDPRNAELIINLSDQYARGESK